MKTYVEMLPAWNIIPHAKHSQWYVCTDVCRNAVQYTSVYAIRLLLPLGKIKMGILLRWRIERGCMKREWGATCICRSHVSPPLTGMYTQTRTYTSACQETSIARKKYYLSGLYMHSKFTHVHHLLEGDVLSFLFHSHHVFSLLVYLYRSCKFFEPLWTSLSFLILLLFLKTLYVGISPHCKFK